MVGGKVKEVVACVVRGHRRLWINVRGTGSEKNDTCAIYVEDTPAARCVEEGDQIWWQGDGAFWTPKDPKRTFTDYRLRRIGCSGVAHPALAGDTLLEHDDGN